MIGSRDLALGHCSSKKKLSIEDTDAIKEFSQKFIVKEKHVKSYLEHLSSLETVKNIRQKQR